MNTATTILPDQKKIGMVSLGCPKALVDSERILTRLRADGYAMSPDYAGADVVLVNTCGFLDSAKEESLQAIGEAIAENGRVIVTGCMGEEAETIRAAHPAVLAITGAHQYESVVEAVHTHAPPSQGPYVDLIPQPDIKLTPRHYSYLKISEGLQPFLRLLHHPAIARQASEPADRRGAARGGEAGRGGHARAAGDQSGHFGLRGRHPP
jgi:ribosomal protein S12 methylthiotransferase